MMNTFEALAYLKGTPYIFAVIFYAILVMILANCFRSDKKSRRQLSIKSIGTSVLFLLFTATLYGIYNFQVPIILINILHGVIFHVLLVFLALALPDDDYHLVISPGQKLLGVVGNLALFTSFITVNALMLMFPIAFPVTEKNELYALMVLIHVLIFIAFISLWYGLRVQMAAKFTIQAGRPIKDIGTLELINGNWVETMEVTSAQPVSEHTL